MFRELFVHLKKNTDYFFIFIFLLVTFVVLQSCLTADFLTYDDQYNVISNPYLRQKQYLYFWSQPYYGLYIPVIYTVWTFLYSLFGLDSTIYHGLNLVVHALNGYLIFLICRQIKMSLFPALFAGALFLFHPIQVESVAWITGLKDTLSFLFCLIGIKLWLLPNKSYRTLFTLFVVLSLAVLSKPTTIALPVALILSDIFVGSDKRSIRNFLPLFAAFLVSLLTVILSYNAPMSVDYSSQLSVSFPERFIISLDSLGFYARKIFIPLDFYPDYARPLQSILQQKLYIVNVLLGLAVIIIWLFFLNKFYKKQNKPLLLCLLMGALFFMPVSGFITFNYQAISTTADRYCYPLIASISILAAYSYGFVQLHSKAIARFAVIGLIFVLSTSSFLQSKVWKNDVTFFEHLLEGNPNSFHAHSNLGVFRQAKGNYKEAINHFQQANTLNPLDIVPVTGLMISYLEIDEKEKLKTLVSSYCQDEQFKKMMLSPSTFIAFRICAEVYQENQQFDRALMFYCRASQQSLETKNELTPVLSMLQKQLNKNCDSYSLLYQTSL